MKKICAVALTLMIAAVMAVVPVSAYSANLTAAVTTDKAEYGYNEPVKVTVTVTNNDEKTITNVNAAAFLPENLTLTEGQTQGTTASLRTGESFTVDFTAMTAAEPETTAAPDTTAAEETTGADITDAETEEVTDAAVEYVQADGTETPAAVTETGKVATGDTANLLFALLICAASVTVIVLVIRNPKNTRKYFSIALVAAIAVTAAVTALPVGAVDTSYSFEATPAAFTVGGADTAINATITYNIDVNECPVQGQVAEASDRTTPISGVSITAMENNKPVGTAITDENGTYNFTLPQGDYTFKFEKDGYSEYLKENTSISSEETNIIDKAYLVKQAEVEGTAGGKIIDAFTGDGVANAKITLTGGSYTDGSAYVVNSDDNGNYTVTLKTGYYEATVDKDGYISANFTISVSADDNPANMTQNCTITPVLADGDYRIVLTWNETPSDLDSHLVAKNAAGEKLCHVYFSHMKSDDSTVTLDVDDTSSYGPETVTIVPNTESTYTYYVYNFSDKEYDSTSSARFNLANSGAQVKLYKGTALLKTFNVPTNGEGTLWQVFTIKNGNEIIPSNVFSYKTSSMDVGSDD